MALSKTTQDHDEIRKWAEERGGKPAEVASTERNGQTGILRLEFPGAVHANDSALKEISWDDFFEKFDASGLALVYQEKTADGESSNFNKLVHPEAAASAAKKAPGKKASAKKSASNPVKTTATPAKKATVPAKKNAAPAKSTTPAKKGTAAKKAAPKKSTTR